LTGVTLPKYKNEGGGTILREQGKGNREHGEHVYPLVFGENPSLGNLSLFAGISIIFSVIPGIAPETCIYRGPAPLKDLGITTPRS